MVTSTANVMGNDDHAFKPTFVALPGNRGKSGGWRDTVPDKPELNESRKAFADRLIYEVGDFHNPIV